MRRLNGTDNCGITRIARNTQILLSAVPCTAAPVAASLNLFLSAVTAAFALPVATSMPWNALPVCLLNSLMSVTGTTFYDCPKSSGFFSSGSFSAQLSLSCCEQRDLPHVFQNESIKKLHPRFHHSFTVSA